LKKRATERRTKKGQTETGGAEIKGSKMHVRKTGTIERKKHGEEDEERKRGCERRR